VLRTNVRRTNVQARMSATNVQARMSATNADGECLTDDSLRRSASTNVFQTTVLWRVKL
jgi:hypothetical protein